METNAPDIISVYAAHAPCYDGGFNRGQLKGIYSNRSLASEISERGDVVERKAVVKDGKAYLLDPIYNFPIDLDDMQKKADVLIYKAALAKLSAEELRVLKDYPPEPETS